MEKFSGYMLWLEGDSSSVVTELKVRNAAVYSSILLEGARRMLMGMEVYNITHMFRESNRRADWLTRWMRGREAQVLLKEDLPLELIQLADANALGICYERR